MPPNEMTDFLTAELVTETCMRAGILPTNRGRRVCGEEGASAIATNATHSSGSPAILFVWLLGFAPAIFIVIVVRPYVTDDEQTLVIARVLSLWLLIYLTGVLVFGEK